jgi:endonuclease YncB( thermonuclease family)
VYDGDTLTVLADLGFAVWRRVSVRVDGINAIELRAPGGLAAREHLKALLPAGGEVTLTSLGWDKYGDRVDGRITLPDGRDVGEVMVIDGYAARWDGTGARPTPPWPIPSDH